MPALYLISEMYTSVIRNLILPGNSEQDFTTAGVVSVLGALFKPRIVMLPLNHLNLMVYKFYYIFRKVWYDCYIIQPAVLLISKLAI